MNSRQKQANNLKKCLPGILDVFAEAMQENSQEMTMGFSAFRDDMREWWSELRDYGRYASFTPAIYEEVKSHLNMMIREFNGWISVTGMKLRMDMVSNHSRYDNAAYIESFQLLIERPQRYN